MKMVRVFGTGIALGYLLGSGRARQLFDAFRSSGAPQRFAPSSWRRVAHRSDEPSVVPTPDVAVFQPVMQPSTQGAGVVAREAARGA